ncbi:MAG: TonB-dependent receptor [Rikenellaceae bacterium]
MKRNLLILTLLLGVLLPSTLWAQSPIRGKVFDEDKEAIVGATVIVKGTSKGTTTDIDGNFSISVSPKQVLEISFIGYETQEITVDNKTSINIILETSAQNMEAIEVVEVGYGTAARRDLTGSVAKADMETIMKSNVTNFDQALSGRVAGVVVKSSDGELGKSASITIRGNNSLTQGNDPLYVVDGFPMDDSVSGILSSSDIESIDILKDASATAIYGARGANGVIVITTKKGVEGAPKITFDASYTVDNLANKMDLMGPYDFVEMQAEFCELSGYTNSYFAALEDGGEERTLEDYVGVDGYDWQDEVYRQAFTQNYSLNLSGGARGGTRYNIGLSVLDQEGILINSAYQRYQGKINIIQPITKKLELTMTANYTNSLTQGVTPTSSNSTSTQSGWLIFSVWGYRPISPDPDTDLLSDLTDYDVAGSNDYRFNPVLSAMNEVRLTKMDNLSINAALNYTISPSFTFRTSGGYTYYNNRREEFNGSMTYTGYAGSTSGKGINGAIYNYNRDTYLNENTLTFKKQLNKVHNINAVAGVSLQGQQYKYDGVSATNLSTESLGLAGLYTGTAIVSPEVYQDWTMLSAFTRWNYNYKYKYYLTATMRADGSSKFPTANRWGYFPSVGASWNFDREDWFKGIWWLSSGKLRSSWGQTGNNRTSTPYDFYAQMTTAPNSSDSYDYVFDGVIVPGYYLDQASNDNLKWETTTQTNFGVDLSFFDSRIKTTVDWYMKDTKDLLLNATTPASSGYTSAMMNIGQIRNTGWEFSIETVNVRTKNFQWTTSFNIAFNSNEIVALANGQTSLLSTISWDTSFNSQYPYISQVGQPTGMMYGYIYEGTYKYDDFILSGGQYTLKDNVAYLSSESQSSIQPGDPKYSDINGDGVVNDNDRTIIGSGQAIHTGGFNNTFNIFNFDLNIFCTWSYGNDILNANRLVFESGQKSNTNQLTSYADRWTADNSDSDIPRVMANGVNVYSSRVIEDGSYLRLSNISLGYTLPKDVVKKIRLQNLRVYASLNNIYTLTSYSGPDPEVSTRSSVLTPGFDWSAYPRTTGATMGINVTF